MGLEPTSGSAPPPVFKTGSSSGRMTSVCEAAEAGIEPTRRRSERLILPLDDSASVLPSETRLAGYEFGEEGSNLRLPVQSQTAYH